MGCNISKACLVLWFDVHMLNCKIDGSNSTIINMQHLLHALSKGYLVLPGPSMISIEVETVV